MNLVQDYMTRQVWRIFVNLEGLHGSVKGVFDMIEYSMYQPTSLHCGTLSRSRKSRRVELRIPESKLLATAWGRYLQYAGCGD